MGEETDRPPLDIAADWAFMHYLDQGKETVRQIMLATGAFLLVSVLAILVNLGSIQTVSWDLGGVRTDLAASWPARLILLSAATLSLCGLVFLVVSFNRYNLVVLFFAERGLLKAKVALDFEMYAAQAAPQLLKVNTWVGVAALLLVLSLYLAVIATFLVSLL
jgi:hypothetical protein